MSMESFWAASVALLLGIIIGAICMDTDIKAEAKKSGAGEYYLDEHDSKKWRWK